MTDSLIDLLQENNMNISLRDYGKEYTFASWEINSILEHLEILIDFYNSFEHRGICDIDDFLLYLFSLKFSNLMEIVPLIEDEGKKKEIELLSNQANEIVNTIDKGSLIKFINGNIEQIFDKKFAIYDIKEIVVNQIKNYSRGICDSVYEYIAEYHGYLLIDDFEAFDSVFEGRTEVFKKLIPNGKLDGIVNIRFEKILIIFAHILRRSKSELKNLVEERINELYCELEKAVNELHEAGDLGREILQKEHFTRLFYEFLDDTRNPKARTFEEIYKKIKKKFEEHLENKGQKFEYEIPVSEILDDWRNEQNCLYRLLKLTHNFRYEDKSFTAESLLSKKNNGESFIIDSVSSNIACDDYFTFSYQMELDFLVTTRTATFMGILNRQEDLQNYMNLISSAINEIESRFEIKNEILTNDFNLLSLMLAIIVENRSANREILRALSYGTTMFICAFIEKMLRVIYESFSRGKMYFPAEKMTLGQLLDLNNESMRGIFNESHKKNLLFFLSKVEPKGIGYNFRNDLAHLSNEIELKLGIPLIAQLLWIFTDVSNSILVFTHKE